MRGRINVCWLGTEQLQGETTLHVLAAPRLSIPRRSAGTDTASSFPCHVWGFYPGDVTVTWLRDGQVLTNVTPSSPQRNSDGTFNLTLTYTFTPTARDSGSIFSCRVSHSALAQPLREEFPLDVTGVDHTSAAIGATLGILVAGGAVAAIAVYFWRKRRKAQRARAEAAEREQQVLQQKEAERQKKLEEEKRCSQENREKLEGERKKLLEEQDKMLDQKVKELEALLRERVQKEAGYKEHEIQCLQQQIKELQKPWIELPLPTVSSIIDNAAGAVGSAVGAVGSAVGAVGNFIRGWL
ncbi:RLA class II histocompatibility antigen, DP beta chain-like [Dermochelys coriacea]|uniref:RLA class II histocompatibility antigen, DP beta chain-like n=1 Tax=Dermochelys coriacea TaxID=27794 RepID=UPI0018E72098|nr:RLA class II histocompatibility antigen, DP beta chain-like [Dermochelys coriacea]